MDPFTALGLDGDADERQVKRAYARQLRTTRPDDDPAGFQRLNEAYQTALQWCRMRADVTPETPDAPDTSDTHDAQSDRVPADIDEPSLPPLSPTPTPHALPAPHVDAQARPPALPPIRETPEDTLDTILKALPPLQAPTAWLRSYEPLYSLTHQKAVSDLLMSRLDDEDMTALPDRCLDALFTFFDIQHGLYLRQRIEARRAVRYENTTAFGEHTPLLIRQLKRRMGPRTWLLACVPGIPERASRLGMRLQHSLGHLPAGLDAEQLRFFAALARPDYWGLWRWAIIALSALLMALTWGMFLAVLGGGSTPLSVYLLPPAATAGALLAWRGYLWLQHLIRKGVESDRWLLSRIPVWLALAGLTLGLGMGLVRWLLLPGFPTTQALIGGVVGPVAITASVASALLLWRMGFTLVRFILAGFLVHAASGLDADILSPFVFAPAMGPLGLLASDAVHAWRQDIPLAAAHGNSWTVGASYMALFCGLGAAAGSYKGFLGALVLGSIIALIYQGRKRR